MSFGYYPFLSLILERIYMLDKTKVPLHVIGKFFIVTIFFFNNCEQKIQVRNTIHMIVTVTKLVGQLNHSGNLLQWVSV